MLKIGFFGFLVYLLTSCTANCEECEKKYAACIQNYKIPVSVPESDRKQDVSSKQMLEVLVTDNESYIINNIDYPLDSLTQVLPRYAESIGTNSIRIEIGNRVLFRPVFKLLSVIQKEGMNPIFAMTDKEDKK